MQRGQGEGIRMDFVVQGWSWRYQCEFMDFNTWQSCLGDCDYVEEFCFFGRLLLLLGVIGNLGTGENNPKRC